MLSGFKIMAKKKQQQSESSPNEQDKLARFIMAHYILWCIGILDEGREAKLDTLRHPGVADWRDAGREQLGVGAQQIRQIFKAIAKHLGEPAAGIFVLRGFDCYDPEFL